MNTVVSPAQTKATLGGTHFLLAIHRQENHSWQGSIQWLDTGQKVHFRSELELMNLIHSALQNSTDAGQTLRCWEDDPAGSACG